jgi:hypothetical protein
MLAALKSPVHRMSVEGDRSGYSLTDATARPMVRGAGSARTVHERAKPGAAASLDAPVDGVCCRLEPAPLTPDGLVLLGSRV